MLDNIFVLLIAGHETTAHTMAFALGLLALHPEKQQAFYNEIIRECGDSNNSNDSSNCSKDDLTYEQVNALKYGAAILQETLRMYPILPALDRKVSRDTVIETESHHQVTIPSGASVIINIAAIHYSEKYWSNPHQFTPERFLSDYNKDAFLSFSEGPRVCLGRRFAQLEFVTAMAYLVRDFEITAPPGSTLESLLEAHIVLTLVPKRSVDLTFTPRRK